MLTIANLFANYAKQKFVLNNVNLKLPTKGFVSIIGESGSGKTTFLKCLSKNLKY